MAKTVQGKSLFDPLKVRSGQVFDDQGYVVFFFLSEK